jgi:hypothetical protein
LTSCNVKQWRFWVVTDAILDGEDQGEIVSAPIMRRMFSISPTTEWRWCKDQALGFPQPIIVRGRRYYRRRELNEFWARQRPR